MNTKSSLREIDMNEIDQVAGGASADYQCNGSYESLDIEVAGYKFGFVTDKSSGTTEFYASKS